MGSINSGNPVDMMLQTMMTGMAGRSSSGGCGKCSQSPFNFGSGSMNGFQMGMMTNMMMGMMNMMSMMMTMMTRMMGMQQGFNGQNGGFGDVNPGFDNGRGFNSGSGGGGGYNPGNASRGGYPGASRSGGSGRSGGPGGSGGSGGGFYDSPQYDPNAPVDERRKHAIQWALSQVGVSERGNPDAVKGYSRGKWQAWCADFVSTALKKAGLNTFGHKSYVPDIASWAKRNGRWTNQPKPGDLIIYSYRGQRPDHVAMVERVNPDGSVVTIGGNESDSVKRKTVSANNSAVLGFVNVA